MQNKTCAEVTIWHPRKLVFPCFAKEFSKRYAIVIYQKTGRLKPKTEEIESEKFETWQRSLLIAKYSETLHFMTMHYTAYVEHETASLPSSAKPLSKQSLIATDSYKTSANISHDTLSTVLEDDSFYNPA